jgi:hypothetical protein
MSTNRPALSTSKKTDIYVNVAEFRSRIAWMNETAFTGQKSEFRDQVLSQSPTHHTIAPEALSVCLDTLLSGMTRIYPSSTGHSVNLRKDYLSMRDVLRSMNDQVTNQIKRARQAMQRLEALSPLTYVVEVNHEVNFNQVVRHQVASPQYLDWVACYMALSRYDQRCVRTYCEVEGEWWWRTEGLEAFPSYAPQGDNDTEVVAGLLAQASHELAGMRSQMSSAAVELLDTRSAPASGEWLWLQPWGVNALAWPATRTLSGDETNHELETEAQYWDALGRSLNWLPFDTIVDAAFDTLESIETYRIATQAWAECLDAGQTIRRLASVLRACSMNIKVPVCDRCYRYVGSGQNARCNVHVTRSSERTQATRAADIAQRYHAQLDALRLQVGNEVIYANIAQVLAKHWKVRPSISTGGSLTQVNAALELHSHGLEKMIRLLKPLVGSVLHKRMAALGDVLQLRVKHILETAAQVDAQEVFSGEAQLSVVEKSLRLLTPPGFFTVWFGGMVPDGVEHFLHQGVDSSHPILRQTVRSRTRSTKKQPIYAFNLNAVLNDLLRHRAWLEIGGEEADQAILRGEALPSDRPRPRMDISLAKALRAKGLSFRQIADELGVSGAAVHKALNKSKPTTSTSTTKVAK